MKKLSHYLGLLTILSSFLVAPLSVVAETEDSQPATSQVSNSQEKSQENDSSADSQSSEPAPVQAASTVTTGQAKELSNVITHAILWDKVNGREVTKNDDVYKLSADVDYAYQMQFDLSDYNGSFNNGDYFTTEISAPMTVASETFDLTDATTGVVVGEAAVTSNGAAQGGSVKITLKNLEEYLAKKGGQEVSGIKGTFYAQVRSSKTNGVTTTTVTNVKNVGTKEIKIQVDARKRSKRSLDPGIGEENFYKYANVATEKHYDSAALGQSGDYVHPWRARVNASKKYYDSLVIHDVIASQSATTKFIPENIEVFSSEEGYNRDNELENRQRMREGRDYTVTFNDSYTEMTITLIKPGSRAYYINYDTTAPLDGSEIANTMDVKGDEKALPVTESNEETTSRFTINSFLTAGGTIDLNTRRATTPIGPGTPPSSSDNQNSSSSSSDNNSSSNTSSSSSQALAPGDQSGSNQQDQNGGNVKLNLGNQAGDSREQAAGSKRVLPNTGEQISMTLVLLGLVLMGGVGFYFYRKKAHH
ncbi:LPXTG cell wall anchor domain-containing protein [Streptococcus oricebi]|uniref:Gram-positive cocci surface proteins LPxTG domain-containing protein n=1 Tax=Streptococcus oricebi TaxID=1547447 RepID=A0ABS5B4E2_9STRE|nr:LPXTG cell wall anchor domain-containing protein [Streptococcus oricebi]MBP2623713.1 hypothetical protein [Streptococcus oricebi]